MGIYDLISEISQSQCEKLYKINFKCGMVDVSNNSITISGYVYNLDDLFVTDAVYSHFEDGSNFRAFCISNDCDIAVIDKLGGG